MPDPTMNFQCPKCQRPVQLDLATGIVACRCGTALDTGLRTSKLEALHLLPEATKAFQKGLDNLRLNNEPAALKAFQTAVEHQPDFLLVHVWIAQLSQDQRLRQHHLKIAVQLNPRHADALHKLIPVTASPEYQAVPVQQLSRPVTAFAVEKLCPICGGHLTYNDQQHRTECRFCGHVMPSVNHSIAQGSLRSALLKENAKSIQWKVAQRKISCRQCGAEQVVSGQRLSQHCRFCGALLIVVEDRLSAIKTPDGLLPFAITPDIAFARLAKALDAPLERLRHLFDAGQKRTMYGIYLPFWAFDMTLELRWTSREPREQTPLQWTETEPLHNVLVCAVESPPAHLMAQLTDFRLGAVIPFKPEQLAKYTAKNYTVEFDHASIVARGIASQTIQSKYRDRAPKMTVTSMVKSTKFRLLLLPIWVADVRQGEHGTARRALINGQTGRVIIGRSS